MKIASLHIYPLKSGRAIDLDSIAVSDWGLDGDRRYMLVDPDGQFITQRELQSLARIRAKGEGDKLDLAMDGRDEAMAATFDPARRIGVTIWKSQVSAAVAGDDINARLSQWLERPVRLVHADDLTQRTCSPDWAGEGVETGFADGYPILVTTTGSLAALSQQARDLGGEAIPMDRFRPNIVIEDDAPFADDRWQTLVIGDIRLDLVKPCTRCIMTTQDQRTGERIGADPMPAMRALRMSADRRVPGVLFGWNAVVRAKGALSVGDRVDVVATKDEGWPLRTRA